MSEVLDKTFDGTALDVPIEGVFMREKRYLLTPLEHRILKESESSLQEWAKRFLLITIGLALTIISKIVIFLYEFSNATQNVKNEMALDIESWELVYLGIGFCLFLILFLLSFTTLDNSEKKKLLKNIKSYFDGQ